MTQKSKPKKSVSKVGKAKEIIRSLTPTEKRELVNDVLPLMCDECGVEISKCDECGHEFENDEDIICDGDYHFCGEDCAKDYFFTQHCPTTTTAKRGGEDD